MYIYLPIAEVSVNAFLLLGLGGIVGVLSGMFGVGGGFLMTPLLFFIGIPPAVAVATEANQIVASSFSGVLAHVKRRTVDFKMGGVLLIGGFAGRPPFHWRSCWAKPSQKSYIAWQKLPVLLEIFAGLWSDWDAHWKK